MGKDVGGGWAAPTRKLTPKPSLTTRPLGRRAIRRLTVRRPIRLPGPLLLSSLGQIESRATGVYTRRRRADIVHESIRNQFLEPRKDRSSGARQPWRATHTRAWSPGYISTEKGGKRQGMRKRKKEGDDVYNDPRKLVNSQGRSVALRGETRERGVRPPLEILFSFRVVILRRCSTTTPMSSHTRGSLCLSTNVRFISVPFSRILVRLYEGGTVIEDGGSQRACADVAAPLFVRFTGTGVN